MEAPRGSDLATSGHEVVDEELLLQAPEDGVYIYGLFIESAVWSKEGRCLTEQRPGVITSTMPIVHFLPFEVRHQADKKSFAARSDMEATSIGELRSNTTGASTAAAKRMSLRPPLRNRKSAMPRRQEQTEGRDEDSRFEGEEDVDLDNPQRYPCPVYKTSARAGVLSTTGQSTNYILSVSLPIDTKEHNAEHWTLRGTAILTMLDA